MTPVHRARTVRHQSPCRMPRFRMSHSPPLISSPCTAARPICVRGLRYTISWRHPREPSHSHVHASFRVRLYNHCSVYGIYNIQNHKTQHEACFPQKPCRLQAVRLQPDAVSHSSPQMPSTQSSGKTWWRHNRLRRVALRPWRY